MYEKNNQVQYDDNSKRAYALFNETCCVDKPCTRSLLYVVDTEKMQIEEIIPIDYPHRINALQLLEPYKVLSNDFVLTDIRTHQSEEINGVSDELFFANGFLREVVLMGNNKIIFTCAKKVFIYNLDTKSIENTISCSHGVTAKIIDDNFWIGTWDGAYIAEKKDM